MFILLDRGIPSIHFEYITASKRDLVTEICKPEVTEPRNGKVIFKKFIVNILMHVCMFMTIECKFVKKVLAIFFLDDHLSSFEFMFKIP